jgi:diguanylate cyclase (GGDEF)-like protein/PAS domain S-box-containing protein
VLAAALKTLQANLRHLIWQVGEVAKGDFSQRIDFMGEFSDSFNSMTQQLERSLTELKEREANLLALTADLKSSEERWNLAIQCSRDGIWDVNLDNQTAWYSDGFMQMMHYTHEDLPQALHWEAKIHPDDHAEAQVMLAILQRNSNLAPFSVECRLQVGQNQEKYRWTRIRGMPVRTGNAHRLIAAVADITAQKTTEQTLIQQAMYDSLTGLPNRFLLNDRLECAVANSRRTGDPFVFATLDLDFFKGINDTYGHAVGDQVLIELANRLRIGLRATDTVARLGGDEFVAIYPCAAGLEQATVENVMKRFYDNLKPPVMLGEVEYQLRSSIGIAFFPHHAKDLSTLFNYADIALYKAKRNGKNQYAVYERGDEDV